MADQQLINIKELGEILGGRSRASVYRDVQNLNGFPQPVKIGKSTRFKLADVHQYLASLGHTGSQAV